MTQHRGIVIVSWPRTGSTLLMGLLNTMPFVRVVGEWGNPFLDLARSVEQMRKWKHIPNPDMGTRWPHFGIEGVDPDGYAQDLAWVLRKHMLASSTRPVVTLGMKINVWQEASEREFIPMTRMFHRVLGEDVLFVVLSRARQDAFASWGLDDNDPYMSALWAAWSRYAVWLQRSRENVWPIAYEQLSTDDGGDLAVTLGALFEAVMRREPTQDELGDMIEVANQPHSSNPTHAAEVIRRRVEA